MFQLLDAPDFIIQGQNILVVERHLADDQRVQGHAQRPDISGLEMNKV